MRIYLNDIRYNLLSMNIVFNQGSENRACTANISVHKNSTNLFNKHHPTQEDCLYVAQLSLFIGKLKAEFGHSTSLSDSNTSIVSFGCNNSVDFMNRMKKIVVFNSK